MARGGTGTGLDHALDALYSESPATFTAKRDALAKKLKAERDADGAARVKALRKPTQIAYVLNQLARRHEDDLADLVDVGRDLARAQRKALRGEAGHDLREAITRQRSVVAGLTTKTAALMRELGISPTGHLDAIASALQAALVDPAVGAQLEEGRLGKVPEAVAGFPGAGMAEETEERREARPGAGTSRKAGANANAKANADADANANADAKAKAKAKAKDGAREKRERAEAQKRERAGAEAAERARLADQAEREADGYAAEANKIGHAARELAAQARKLFAEAKRVAHDADVARRAWSRADKGARTALAEAKRARADAERAIKNAKRTETRV